VLLDRGDTDLHLTILLDLFVNCYFQMGCIFLHRLRVIYSIYIYIYIYIDAL